MKLLCILLFTFVCYSCASRLVINTVPNEADIYIRNQNTIEKKLIGKSPVSVTWAELTEKSLINSSLGDYVEIIVEKNGKKQERVLVPVGRFNTLTTDVTVNLNDGVDEGRIANTLVSHLFIAQEFVRKKSYERALIEVDKALVLDPMFVRAHSMKGSIYYLQGQYKESLQSFESALKLDPQFEEAAKMIAFIKQNQDKDITR